MKQINIQNFLGEAVCTELEDVKKMLDWSIDGVNEFLFAQDRDSYPYLIVLVNGSFANVGFISKEGSAGLQAFSDDAEMDLDPDESTIFYTNTPTEEIEICNDHVIPKDLAIQIAIEFAKQEIYQIVLSGMNYV